MLQESAHWASVFQPFVSIVGFIVLIYQVMQLRKNLRGATQDRLYAHYTEIIKALMQKPYLYPYFYNKIGITEARALDTERQYEIEIMAEMILGLIEHSKLQQENLPIDAWKHCWKPYAFERIHKSDIITDFFEDNRSWYTDALHSVFKDYRNRRP